MGRSLRMLNLGLRSFVAPSTPKIPQEKGRKGDQELRFIREGRRLAAPQRDPPVFASSILRISPFAVSPCSMRATDPQCHVAPFLPLSCGILSAKGVKSSGGAVDREARKRAAAKARALARTPA